MKGEMENIRVNPGQGLPFLNVHGGIGGDSLTFL